MVTTTYSDARARLAQIWDGVEDSREEALLTRRGHEDMALIPADELRSLRETAYLLRSPENARRLLAALEGSRASEGRRFDSIEAVAEAAGLKAGP